MKGKHIVDIKLEDELIIRFVGNYTPSEKEIRYTNNGDGYPGSNAEFDIIDMQIISGNLIDYTSHIEQLLFKNPELNILDHFSELITLNLEENV